MDAALPLALLAMGLASGVHCLGMCGGIVAAFSAQQPLITKERILKRQAAFNAGRICVGLHLAGVRTPVLWIERLGAPLWRRLQPFAAGFLQKPFVAGAYGAGAVWGWLPCGLVYGLGTLPWLLAAGVAAARLRSWISHRPVRAATGSLVVAYGAWGLAHSLLLGGYT